MSKAQVRKEMNALTREQLVDVVLQLYTASGEAKDWLELYVKPEDPSAVLEKYKNELYDKFYKRSGEPKPLNFRDCNKLVTAFKKLVPDPRTVADFMLFYLETAASLTIDFGDMYESYYTSIENNFEKAMAHIEANDLMEEFRPRIEKFLYSVSGCGWGFPDVLKQIFRDYAG